jgi:hypothetical protein
MIRRQLRNYRKRVNYPIAAGGAGFTVNAVDFDGTNDFLTRGAGLTGAADALTGIFSAWVRLDGGDGAARVIFTSAAAGVVITVNTGNKFLFTFTDVNTDDFSFQTVNAYTAGATWRHVLASWNITGAVQQLYITDASDKAAGALDAIDVIDYTQTDWAVGGTTAGGSKFNGCMAELYFAPGQFLDFSVEANRRKFISAAGKPVDLGADGSTPTGTAPLVYLNGDETTFGTNAGTGGNFTITGTLTAASTSPSD